MPTLVIPKTYRDGKAPRVSDLDNIRLSVEAFFNDTKLDNANIDLAAISAVVTAAQAKTLIDTSNLGEISENQTSTGTPSVTIVESGYYLIFIVTDKIITTPDFGSSGVTTVDESVIFYINGVAEYSKTLTVETRINTTLTADLGLGLGTSGQLVFARALTQGDILSLNQTGSISVIKLYET